MDAFSYLSVLLSIIVGLAMTQVLQGYRALLLARGRVKLSAAVLIWSVLLLLFATQAWWASFGLRTREHWDFLAFAVILLQMILLYMMAAVIFPELGPGDSVDLVEHFVRHRGAFFGFLIAMLCTSVAKDGILDHRLPSLLNLAFHLFLGVLAIIAVIVKGARMQLIFAVAGAASFVAYVAVLFASI